MVVADGARDLDRGDSHGQWLVDHVPGARARLFPDHGHLSLTLSAYGEILDDLLEQAG